MKKILALLLALLMVFTLVACAAKAPETPDAPEVENTEVEVSTDEKPYEGVTVTMGFYGDPEVLTADKWIFQKITEATGVIIEPVCYDAETYNQKMATWVATNSFPDMFDSGNMSFTEINTYGDLGAFVNLNDPEILAQLPNFKSLILDNEVAAQVFYGYGTSAGANYLLPTYKAQDGVTHPYMYREDVFADLGLEVWTDTESFLNCLRTIKEAYPESYPFTGAMWDVTLDRLVNHWGINNGYRGFDWENMTWYLSSIQPAYRDMLDFLRTMYQEKLMDPDIFTNTSDMIDAKILSNQSFVYHSWMARCRQQNPVGIETDPDFHVTAGPNVGTTGQWQTLSTPGMAFDGVAICNNDKQGACLAVMNWLYGEEGIRVMSVGNDEIYYVDEEGNTRYPELEEELETVVSADVGAKYGVGIEQYKISLHPDALYYSYTPEEELAQEYGRQQGWLDPIPAIVVSDEDQTAYTDLWTNMKKDTDTFSMNYVIQADLDTDAAWEAHVEEFTTNYTAIIDILNKNVR